MPACSASHPACSPRTSTTAILRAALGRLATRSSISIVKLSALLKPKDTMVAAMSFSIDRGTHTVLSPLRWSL